MQRGYRETAAGAEKHGMPARKGLLLVSLMLKLASSNLLDKGRIVLRSIVDSRRMKEDDGPTILANVFAKELFPLWRQFVDAREDDYFVRIEVGVREVGEVCSREVGMGLW